MAFICLRRIIDVVLELLIILITFQMSARTILTKVKPTIWVVLGSTGTGKSKLAIEIAQKIHGEIISADSMQVYKELDIVTNKVTKHEQSLVPHHMLDFLDSRQRFTVVDFRNKVLSIIDKLLKENKSPVIVGGTYYYVESILWRVLLSNEDPPDGTLLFERDVLMNKKLKKTVNKSEEKRKFYSVYQNDIDLISNDVLHDQLILVDVESADRIHPNDRRKVIRALQVYEQTGQKMSKMLQDQKTTDGGSSLGGPLRYSNVQIIWLKCEQKVLDERLDSRVDEMISRGLIEELIKFNEILQSNEREKTFTNGILQSIGFKEFHDYLKLLPEERLLPHGVDCLGKSIEALKVATRRYSRKQTKWIKNRFLKRPDRPLPPVYELDATDLNKWEENVSKKAEQLVTGCNNDDVKISDKLERNQTDFSTFFCQECNTRLIGDIQFNDHMKSNRHKKRVYNNNKRKTRVKELVTE